MIKYKFVVSLRNWFNFDLWKKRGKFGFKSILRYLTSENLIINHFWKITGIWFQVENGKIKF